jgi:hypothetical protein
MRSSTCDIADSQAANSRERGFRSLNAYYALASVAANEARCCCIKGLQIRLPHGHHGAPQVGSAENPHTQDDWDASKWAVTTGQMRADITQCMVNSVYDHVGGHWRLIPDNEISHTEQGR